jgi:lactoylglutathione lyase
MISIQLVARRALIILATIAFTASFSGNTAAQEPPLVTLGYAILWVKDVDKAAEFYESAFGLSVKRKQDMGRFKWLEMKTGATTLAFAGETEIQGMFPDGFAGHDAAKRPIAAQISFVTKDVQGSFLKAVAAGATAITPPAKMPWGQTWAQLRDPNGVLISIASPLP